MLRSAVARLYRQLAFAEPAAVEPGVVTAFTYHHRQRARVAHYLDTAHRMLPELRNPFELERITVPVLLVWGDRDRLVFARGAKRCSMPCPAPASSCSRGSATARRWRRPSASPSCCMEFGDEREAATVD